ncbi:hypothetical protein Y032_0227g2844 [Ancylostoma ceylanicum]|uniref:Uncharacterized protein n=1 Tax=Ancylostoma ceylanicum TaxID=53326 RepID=A0A016SGY5_9BILA|nr:hypothetical protein Y032_0227g2844 [Ancylostoma ceylanicum]
MTTTIHQECKCPTAIANDAKAELSEFSSHSDADGSELWIVEKRTFRCIIESNERNCFFSEKIEYFKSFRTMCTNHVYFLYFFKRRAPYRYVKLFKIVLICLVDNYSLSKKNPCFTLHRTSAGPGRTTYDNAYVTWRGSTDGRCCVRQ